MVYSKYKSKRNKIQKSKSRKSRKFKKLGGAQLDENSQKHTVIFVLDNNDGLVRRIHPQSFSMIDENSNKYEYEYDNIVITGIKILLDETRMKISGFIKDSNTPFDMIVDSITPMDPDEDYHVHTVYNTNNSYFVGAIHTEILGNIEERENEAERLKSEKEAQRIEDEKETVKKKNLKKIEDERLKAEKEALRKEAEKEAEKEALIKREAKRAAEREVALRELAEKEAHRIQAQRIEAQRIEAARLIAEKEEDEKAIKEGKIPDRIKGSNARIQWAKNHLGWNHGPSYFLNQGLGIHEKSEPADRRPEPKPAISFSGDPDPWYRK